MNTEFLTSVAEILEQPITALSRESNSSNCDTWDSMRHWTLISELERIYGTEFSMDEAASFECLGDIHDNLVSKGKLVGSRTMDGELDNYPLTKFAIAHVSGRFAFMKKGIEAAWMADGQTWLQRCERIFTLLKHQAGDTTIGFKEALDGYVKLSLEYLKLQAELRRTGKYHFSTYDEARTAVYDNPAVMEAYYLHGVLTSAVFWKNHYDVLKLYEDSFLPRLSETSGQNVEVGCGHGYFTARLLEVCAGWTTTAIDISASSRGYTQATLAWAGIDPSRWSIQSGDINAMPFKDGELDNAVCGELLEHLEDPTHALGELRRVVKKGGRCWMTTAVYAANIDHIHLFHTVEEVRKMISEAGWRIETERIFTIEGQSWEPGMRDIPFTYAAILR